MYMYIIYIHTINHNWSTSKRYNEHLRICQANFSLGLPGHARVGQCRTYPQILTFAHLPLQSATYDNMICILYAYIYYSIYIYVWGTFRSYYAYAGCSRLHRFKRFTRIKRIEIIKRFDRFKYLILLNLLIPQSFKRFKIFKYLILLNLLIL